MHILVLLFFLHNVLATFLLGGKFVSRENKVFKNFGIALLLNGVAFAIWSVAVVMKPEELAQYVTFGAVFFIASLIFYLIAGTQKLSSSNRRMLTAMGVVAGVAVFYVRTYVDPSASAFSSEGLFFFNVQPLAQLLYIAGLALTALPAIDMVASNFKSPFAALVRYGFIAEVVGGIMLITSKDVQTLTITGWIIGVVYFVLWTTLLFNRKAWAGSK